MSSNVYALVSLYRPSSEVVSNVETIAAQVKKVFLCDNSDRSNAELFQKVPNVEYIGAEKNLGIPRAFNTVLNRNKFNNDDFIVFFDQDSRIKNGHIEDLVSEYQNLENLGVQVGCLGPEFYNASNRTIERPKLKTDLTEYTYKVNNIITSSMISKYATLKKVNFWNENLFLDFCDWDICWRLKQAGYAVCMTNVVTLRHKVGLGDKNTVVGRVRVSEPIREYYQVRDSLFLLQEKYVPVKMRFTLFRFAYTLPIKHMLMLDQKIIRRNYIRRGYYDYKVGIHGEYRVG